MVADEPGGLGADSSQSADTLQLLRLDTNRPRLFECRFRLRIAAANSGMASVRSAGMRVIGVASGSFTTASASSLAAGQSPCSKLLRARYASM